MLVVIKLIPTTHIIAKAKLVKIIYRMFFFLSVKGMYIGTSVWRSSGRRSGGRLLANDLLATIFISLFLFFFFHQGWWWQS